MDTTKTQQRPVPDASLFTIIQQYKTLINQHPEWRNDLLIYFSWLFMFSMWVGGWRGPGNPFPQPKDPSRPIRTKKLSHNPHMSIELNVYDTMMTTLQVMKPELYSFIDELPYFNYGWGTDVGGVPTPLRNISDEITIENVIQETEYGDPNAHDVSDILSSTAIVYLTRVMGVPINRIDDLLTYVTGLLMKYTKINIFKETRSISTVIADADAMMKKYFNEMLQMVNEHSNILNIRQPQQLSELEQSGQLTMSPTWHMLPRINIGLLSSLPGDL